MKRRRLAGLLVATTLMGCMHAATAQEAKSLSFWVRAADAAIANPLVKAWTRCSSPSSRTTTS